MCELCIITTKHLAKKKRTDFSSLQSLEVPSARSDNPEESATGVGGIWLHSICGVGMKTNGHIFNQSRESSWVPQSPRRVYHQGVKYLSTSPTSQSESQY